MKIHFEAAGSVPSEKMESNIAYAKTLNLPPVTRGESYRLAVIGGGPSIKSKADEIKSFKGERWIIGTAFKFCRENGIEGAFFNIDPQPLGDMDVTGVKKAIVATCVDRSVLEALNCEIQAFDLVSEADRTNHGPSSATAAPELAMQTGYLEVIFYGCEGSFPGHYEGDEKLMHGSIEGMRAYECRNAGIELLMRIECSGEVFYTVPEFLMQCEYLATMMRLFPPLFKEASGGLLRAMVKDPEYNVTHGTQALHDICHKEQPCPTP